MKTGWLGMISVVVVGLGLSGVPETSEQYGDPAGECAAADPVAWFAENVDATTLTYEKFLEYSPAERVVVTGRVNVKLRSMLRREHLARAAQDDRFSSEQKAVIERVRAWHEQLVTDQVLPAARDLEAAVSHLFSREEAWLAFRLLGSSDLAAASASPAGVVPGAGGEPWWLCNCRWITDCADDPDSRCDRKICLPLPGCGPFDWFWCLHRCEDVVANADGG